MESILHIHFDTIGSTNTWAKQNLDRLAHEGLTLITASEQTAGRGRSSRKWYSPRDQNLYATFCSFFDTKREDYGNFSQILALAAVEVLEELGFCPLIKWPNDLLLNKRKIGGILGEIMALEQNKCMILGIGININSPYEGLQKIDRPATSLFVESGQIHSIEMVRKNLENKFNVYFNQFLNQGYGHFFDRIASRLFHSKGDPIQFHANQTVIKGFFDAFLPNGSIQICLQDGSLKNFISGEFVQ
ncbi:MAG: biotin--[acetyl-CoA-carboxylase] ligase [Candidatus Protochlamydia sp.]|nr:biotin--[acetyl-CoA-carboxylase] ligase [Candidatus Protochlamydia sp.]